MNKDSNVGTIIVAFALCFTCSIVVSAAAVGLQEKQEFNKQLDIKKNILMASGLIESSADQETIVNTFERVKVELVNLNTGELAKDISVDDYDANEALSNPELSSDIASDNDLAGIKKREKYSKVYSILSDSGEVEQIIFPVRGKGLWSTMYGFLAVTPDVTTVKGLTFYQHGETPGLGGEIENPSWQAQFDGKIIFGDNGSPALRVVKGRVNPTSPTAKHSVDGLSGATITSNGVTGMLRFWLGEQGFGPYIDRRRNG